jgi:hypothetical protein
VALADFISLHLSIVFASDLASKVNDMVSGKYVFTTNTLSGLTGVYQKKDVTSPTITFTITGILEERGILAPPFFNKAYVDMALGRKEIRVLDGTRQELYKFNEGDPRFEVVLKSIRGGFRGTEINKLLTLLRLETLRPPSLVSRGVDRLIVSLPLDCPRCIKV